MISDTILVEWWWSLQSANTCLLNNQTIEQPRVELNNKYHIIVPLHCLCPCLSFEFIWLLLFIYFGVVSAQAKPLCVSFISVKLFVFIVVHCICHYTSYIWCNELSFHSEMRYFTRQRSIHNKRNQLRHTLHILFALSIIHYYAQPYIHILNDKSTSSCSIIRNGRCNFTLFHGNNFI